MGLQRPEAPPELRVERREILVAVPVLVRIGAGSQGIHVAATDEVVALKPPRDAIDSLGLSGRFSHVSTGGGATLEYLEGKTLPGIAILKEA